MLHQKFIPLGYIFTRFHATISAFHCTNQYIYKGLEWINDKIRGPLYLFQSLNNLFWWWSCNTPIPSNTTPRQGRGYEKCQTFIPGESILWIYTGIMFSSLELFLRWQKYTHSLSYLKMVYTFWETFMRKKNVSKLVKKINSLWKSNFSFSAPIRIMFGDIHIP